MSDSDSDCLSPRNLFNFDNESSITKAVVKGPNFQSKVNLNLTNMSNMPQNYDRRMYDDGFSQRSERSRYDRRETSPMSMRSMPGYQPRGFQQSFYPGAMAHSSMMSSRAVSPTMSMRSMNSNMSSCDFILSALHNMQFNKYELRNIEKTCNKLLRGRIQKKHSKREKLKSFLKGVRRRPSYDSGDLGSDSSTSSDDRRSTKTSATMYRGHNRYNSYRYPQSGQTSDDARSVRSLHTDITDVRRTIRDPDLYRDRTESIKQNSFKNIFSLGPRNMNCSSMSRNNTMNMSRSTVMGPPQSWMDPPHNRIGPPNRTMGPPLGRMGPPQSRMGPPQSTTQRERFKNSFLLPSQRFNRSNVSSIPEESNRRHKEPIPSYLGQESPSPKKDFRGFQPATDLEESEHEEIFNEITVLEKTIQKTEDEIRGKRNMNCLDEPSKPESKRNKMATPKKAKKIETPKKTKGKPTPKKTPKNSKKPEKATTKTSSPKEPASMNLESDFVFVKPHFPLKTQNKVQKKPAKNTITEPIEQKKLESKESIQPKPKYTEPPHPHPKEPTVHEILAKDKQNLAEELKDKTTDDQSETTLQSTSDVSLRPSFMKRKLFTQTLDVTEIKNGSNDSLSSSPQSIYDTKEKSRTRKLVTNSHYLSRDIQNDESNLLDLIHKIVPAEKMNLTQINNRSSDPTMGSKKEKPECNLKSKSAVNVRNMTDSFTDEDIFVDKKSQREKLLSKCAVVIDKIDDPRMRLVVEKSKLEIVKASKEEKPLTATAPNTYIVKGKTPRKVEQTKKDVMSKALNFWNCDSESDAAETPQKKPTTKALDSAKKRRDSPTVKNIVKEIQAVVPTKGTKVTSKTVKSQSPAVKKGLNKTLTKLAAKTAPPLQDVGDKLNSSKTLRLKAVKELKEKKAVAKPLKPVDLEETLYDVIKKRRARNSSSTLESSKDNSNNLTIINKAKGSSKQIKATIKAEKPTEKDAVTKLQTDKTKTKLENIKPQAQKTNAQEKAKPQAETTKLQLENPVANQLKSKQTKPNKANLNTTKLSPIKKTRSSPRLNTTELKAPKVTVKKIVTKNIANTVTKDLNQTMTLRRQSMKLNQSRRSMSMQEKTTKTKPKQNIVQKTTKVTNENKAPGLNNNNIEKIKTKTVLDTMTESDASLNTTRRRGRPRKDAANNNTAPPKKQINANKENDNPNKSIRVRKTQKICACCDDAPGSQLECKPTLKVTQTTIDRFAVPQPRKIDSPPKTFANANTSRRVRKKPGQGDETQWGLGLTNATIGMIPRHCGTNELNRTNLDESKSMSIRSIASTSVLTRSRRPKFLHVF